MKLNTETRDITRSGSFRETGFRIAANAKAFDILSSKLYTDTRLAIVRELSTNAYDAQVDAGNKDRPFDVHLPNTMEQYFSIRDYGTGMSQETVETVYTTYFESTRSSSNEFVGALGLGSKSPFSYTDQFTITSFFNGIEYTYSAFKGETGEPSIALLNQKPTTEENGVQIRINVDYWVDGSNFARAAKDVYQFFNPRPNITGIRLDFPEVKPLFSGPGYAMYSQADFPLPSAASVVMGNVRYSVPNDIPMQVGSYGRLVIFTTIGECSIAASREQLHVDSQTRTNLTNRMQMISNDINAQLKTAIDNETCLMNKLIALNKYAGVFKYDSSIVVGEMIHATKDGIYSLRRAWTRNDRMTVSDNRFASQLNFSDKAPIFIHDDLIVDWRQKDKNKLRHFLISNGYKEAFIAKIEDETEFKRIFGEPAIAMSKLPDVPKTNRGPRSVGSNKLFVKIWNGSRWCNVDQVVLEKSCVIARNGNKIVLNGVDHSADTAYISAIARSLGFENVYGIASSRMAKINDELDLPLLEEEMKEHIEKYVKALDKYDLCRMIHGVTSLDLTPDNLKKLSSLSQYCADLLALSKAKDINRFDKFLMTCFAIAPTEAENFQEKFKQRYPLLSNVNLYYANITDVIEYIALKEKKNAN